MGIITGDIRALLSGERVALNYLQRMSGIATYTHSVAMLLEGTKTKLLDTRKTTPNMRIFEKYAVRVGGGYNHRYNLSDGVLLKDNHIGAAGSVKKAVQMAREYAPFVRRIEVEVENLDMVQEALEAGADIIMLDNMSAEEMKKAVECGYWHLYRYDPRRIAEGKNPFQLDSPAPDTDKLMDFLMGENRFASLKNNFPERADALYQKEIADVKARYQKYRKMAED